MARGVVSLAVVLSWSSGCGGGGSGDNSAAGGDADLGWRDGGGSDRAAVADATAGSSADGAGAGGDAGGAGPGGCPHDVCKFASVGLGFGRSCTVGWDGAARCWGASAAASTVPAGRYLQVLPFDKDTTIALQEDGRVIYFGGRLDQPLPRDDKLIAIATSPALSCGLRPDHSMSCWGQGNVTVPPAGAFAEVTVESGTACGRRDDGSITCWPPIGNEPIVTPAGPWKQVRANRYYACGIRQDDTLVCWGDSHFGFFQPPLGRFRKLEMSDQRACALANDGAIICWGGMSAGPESAPHVGVAGSFVELYFRGGQGCGIRRDGAFVCFGTNEFGEATLPEDDHLGKLGGACALTRDGAITCWGIAPEKKAPWPDGPFVDLDGFPMQGCALGADRTARCWQNEVFTSMPLVPPAMHTYSQVRVSYQRACGVRSDTQEIECWGGGPFSPPPPPPPGKFTSFELGNEAGCGVRADGSIQCWDRSGSSAVVANPAPAGNWKQVALAADESACALSTAGEIACWGLSLYLPAPIPAGPFTQLAGGGGWKALRPDGSLVVVGTSASSLPLPPGKFVELSRWRPCALDDAGALRCWDGVLR
jgi:hypothetical protein